MAETTSAPQYCARCGKQCGWVRYYLNDLRDGFVQTYVYCSEACAKKDRDGDG